MSRRPPQPLRIAIPGLRNSIGLGSAVAAATSRLGIAPCSSCERRARALDGRIVLTARRRQTRG